MKIFLLSSAESAHTVRWVNELSCRGINIFLFSHTMPREKLHENVAFCKLKFCGALQYFLNVPFLRFMIFKHKPDVVHAHFASGYGTLACNSTDRYLLSVWGDDVYEFPRKSNFHRYLLTRALRKASAIYSTSYVMKDETLKYTDKDIIVIPFGVEADKFDATKTESPVVRIGLIKVLAPKYGVNVLLDAYHELKQRSIQLDTSLAIYGDGPELPNLIEQHRLHSSLTEYRKDEVTFFGRINNVDVAEKLREIDIFVVPSVSDGESFGVVAVEAGAAATPCIVSKVGGLPEVVQHGKTGIVVEKQNPVVLANALETLVSNANYRRELGNNARAHVRKTYAWQDNVDSMVQQYDLHVQVSTH